MFSAFGSVEASCSAKSIDSTRFLWSKEWLFRGPALARDKKLTSVPAISLPLLITAIQLAIQSLRTQLPPRDSHS